MSLLALKETCSRRKNSTLFFQTITSCAGSKAFKAKSSNLALKVTGAVLDSLEDVLEGSR